MATAGFQVEGGFNGWGMPTNNWVDWELWGPADQSGVACRLWDRPDMLLNRAAALGCERFRLSIEWARVQPGFDVGDAAPPPYDDTALDGYADLVVALRRRGMEPLVTLHHFTHPRWLGLDLWGVGAKLPFFFDYVETVVDGIGRRLISRGQEPVLEWLTVAQPNHLALGSGLLGVFPGAARRGPATAARWLDHLLAAHCGAYDAVHGAHERNGWPTPRVSTNNVSLDVDWLDGVLTRLLMARERERDPAEVVPPAFRSRFPATFDALSNSPRSAKLDYVAIDWFDPVAARHLGRLRRPRRWSPRTVDRRVGDAAALTAALRRVAADAPGKPVVVTASGMCSMWPVTGERSTRPDGQRRPEYLARHLEAVRRAVDEGVDVTGYYHHTLADGYEWGSYTPRFGIHAVDRSRGNVVILDVDAQGDDSAAAFRRLAEEMAPR